MVHVDIAALGTNRVVTAGIATNLTQKLVVWDMNANGSFTRKGDFTFFEVSRIGIAAVSTDRVVTAVRSIADGKLKLVAWQITPQGQIQFTGGATAGEVDELAVANLGGRIGTAVRTASGNLKAILWRIDGFGHLVRTGDTGTQGGTTSRADITRFVGEPLVFATAGRTGGNLSVITWKRQ